MAAPVINTPAHLEHRIKTPDGRTLAVAGAPGYEIRAFETRSDALRDAAVAIETTGAPAVLTWRGARTWVMTGFQDAAEMQRNFLPWKRPEGKYPDRDGLWITVVPTRPTG